MFDWREIDPGTPVTIGRMHCRFSRTAHGPVTLAVGFHEVGGPGAGDRATGPAAAPPLAYSADSGPGWSVGSFGTGTGTFVCEATYTRGHEGFAGHLSGRQAGAMASAAGVGTLVLTHRWPSIDAAEVRDEAQAEFAGPVEVATPGAVFWW